MITESARRSDAARRTGYLIGALVNLALLLLVNVWPDWTVVPFLTDGMTSLLALVNLTVLANLVTSAVFAVRDPPRLVALGALVTNGLGLASLVRFWQVFPFDFGDAPVDWALVARVVLIVGIAGTVVALVVQVIRLASGRSDNA